MLILEKPWLSLVLCLCIAIPICIGVNLLLDVPSWANPLVGVSSGLLAIKFTEMVYASRKKNKDDDKGHENEKYKGYEIVPMPVGYDKTQRFMIMLGWDYIQVPSFLSVDAAKEHIDERLKKNKDE